MGLAIINLKRLRIPVKIHGGKDVFLQYFILYHGLRTKFLILNSTTPPPTAGEFV